VRSRTGKQSGVTYPASGQNTKLNNKIETKNAISKATEKPTGLLLSANVRYHDNCSALH